MNKTASGIFENQMGERCLVLLNNFKKQNFDKKNIIDSSNLTKEEVCKQILENKNFII